MDHKREDAIAELWKKKRIAEKAIKKKGSPFYFLDGPPYAGADHGLDECDGSGRGGLPQPGRPEQRNGGSLG